MFLKNVAPRLIKANVLGKERNVRDHQDRFHVAMSMERVHDALRRASGSVDEFLSELSPEEAE